MSKIFFKDLQGVRLCRRTPHLRSLNRSFFRSFIEALGLSSQVRPICAQVAPSWAPGGPSWAPSGGSDGRSWVQVGDPNRSKIDQQIDHLLDHFFWSIFDRFLVDFGPNLASKISKKSIKIDINIWCNNILTIWCRCPQNPIKTNAFLRFLLCRLCFVGSEER